MQKKTEGICFAISAGICWGSMGVAAQVLMEDSGFTVGDLVAGRLLGAGVLLMFEHFFMRRSLLKYFSQPGVAKDIPLYGVLVLLTQLTFFLAIQCSNAGTAAILAATIPVFTTIWDIFVKHRAPQIREMACTALAIIAVVLITTKGDFDSVSLSLTGVLWGLASSVAGAASNIQPNAVLKKIPVTVVVGGGMTVGGIVMSIFFPPGAIEANWTTQSALFYTYIVVVGTLVFFLLYVSSLKMISATSASLLSCFEPITAVVLSVVLLGAPLTPAEGVGGVLVFAAVWLLASRKKAQA